MSGKSDGSEPAIRWLARSVDEFSAAEFLQLAKLRVDVFVVEQECIYPEFDQLDALPTTLHITGTQNEYNQNTGSTDNKIHACARVIFARTEQDMASLATSTSSTEDQNLPFARIGRVAVTPESRSSGLAREMLCFILSLIQTNLMDASPVDACVGTLNSPSQTNDANYVMLSSQSYIVPFYESLGFVVSSEPYLEDGIEHVDMRRIINRSD